MKYKSVQAAAAKALAAAAVSLSGFAAAAANHDITQFSTKAADAVIVRPGDTLTLPADETYRVNNARIASLGADGRTVTVLSDGILGISRMSGEDVADTLAVVSLPETAGGRVFLFRETYWNRGQWTDASSWTRIPGGEGSDYPHLAGDIAIIARFADGWAMDVGIDTDIALSGLYYGSFRDFSDNQEAYSFRLRGSGEGTPTLSFAGVGSSPAVMRLCPNLLTDQHKTYFKFGSSSQPLAVSCASDTEIDFGWDGRSSSLNLAFLQFTSDSTLSIPAGRKLSFTGSAPHQNGNLHADIQLKGVISGSGTVENLGRENMLCDFSDAGAFTGTIRDSAYRHDGFDRDATTWFYNCTSLTQATLEVRGCVVRTDYRTYDPKNGAGYARIGMSHTWPGQTEVKNRLPGKALVLNGGRVDLMDEQKQWSEGAENEYFTKTLDVAGGFSVLTVQGNGDSSYPRTHFAVDGLRHSGKGTLAIRCNRIWATSASDRVDCRLGGFAELAVNGIIPWLAAWSDQPEYGTGGGWESLGFPTVDADGELSVAAVVTTLAEAGETSNVSLSYPELEIAEDKTVNSLVLNNGYGGNRCFGEGRTLTIASGALMMVSKSKLGKHDWADPNPSPACGTLAFGDTAYVWANNANATGGDRSWIMTPMAAPKGMVFAMAGNISVCADQRGIDGEIAVNAGQLTLGLEAENDDGADLCIPCLLDVSVRIAGGAKIALSAGTRLPADREIRFEDAGGFPGRLEIPEDNDQTCLKCYVDGVTLARGTWGATGSGAANVDDEHFLGAGVLTVRKDDLRTGMIILVK